MGKRGGGNPPRKKTTEKSEVSQGETGKRRRSTQECPKAGKSPKGFSDSEKKQEDLEKTGAGSATNKSPKRKEKAIGTEGVPQEQQSKSNRSRSRSKSRNRSKSRSQSPPNSRSVSPPGVDHRPKPTENLKPKESDNELQTEQEEVSEHISKEHKTPSRRGSKAKAATFTEESESDDDTYSLKLQVSDGDFSDQSVQDSEPSSESSESEVQTSEDEDVTPYKRRKRTEYSTPEKRSRGRSRGRSRSQSRPKKLKRRRTRSRSTSRSRKRKHGKSKKRNKRDVDQIVMEALNKQRIEMEKYFEKFTNPGSAATPEPSKKKFNFTVKSPSDTAIYAPAVKQFSGESNSDQNSGSIVDGFIRAIRDNVNISDVITESHEAGSDMNRESILKEREVVKQKPTQSEVESAIIQAEKFRAQVENPKGKELPPGVNLIDTLYQKQEMLEDGSFVQISCHVEQLLYGQCERGEYVHLPKLMPKPRDKLPGEEDFAVELHNKEGRPYWAPVTDKDNKITNVRQWEQCFRVYAAIYSKANPTRVAEIWQYLEIINQAAATFV